MSKLIEADCVAGVVTADGVPVPSADILSEGVGSSDGVLFLDEDLAFYIPKGSPDLKTALTKLIALVSQLTTALTAIDSKVMVTTCPAGSGTAGPTPMAAASIAQITSIQAELSALKEMLK